MSIKDCRLLEFDEAALRGAFSRCARQAVSLGINADSIETLAFVADRQEVVVHTREGEQKRTSTLRTAELAALLIAYCAVLRVPVPRRPGKRIEITADRVRMSVSQMIETPGEAARGVVAASPAAAPAPARAMLWK